MSRRTVVLAIVVPAIVAAVVHAYASPYLTVKRVREAAARGDAETVNAHADFQALRESVKGWMGAVMAPEVAKEVLVGNPFGALGAALAVTLADRMVEAMVTPEMVRMMLAGQPPRLLARRPGDIPAPSQAPQDAPETLMRYEAFDRFVVTMRGRTQPQEEFSLVWRRNGLTTWKLSALRLPASVTQGTR
jgi:hypothetical protein